MSTTTPTGIPVLPCPQCGDTHPITRTHCSECGSSALFCHPGAARVPAWEQVQRHLTADALRTAARESVKVKPDPQSGERHGDPLRDLIPGDGAASAEVLALVRFVTGRTITRDDFLNTAPAARAALRRWAVLNPETENAQ